MVLCFFFCAKALSRLILLLIKTQPHIKLNGNDGTIHGLSFYITLKILPQKSDYANSACHLCQRYLLLCSQHGRFYSFFRREPRIYLFHALNKSFFNLIPALLFFCPLTYIVRLQIIEIIPY